MQVYIQLSVGFTSGDYAHVWEETLSGSPSTTSLLCGPGHDIQALKASVFISHVKGKASLSYGFQISWICASWVSGIWLRDTEHWKAYLSVLSSSERMANDLIE